RVQVRLQPERERMSTRQHKQLRRAQQRFHFAFERRQRDYVQLEAMSLRNLEPTELLSFRLTQLVHRRASDSQLASRPESEVRIELQEKDSAQRGEHRWSPTTRFANPRAAAIWIAA